MPTPELNLKGLRILIVDDDSDAREILRALLEGQDACIQSASSVDEALKILSEETIDMLISDLGMPNRDGYDLIRSIRSQGVTKETLPAIALSAFARDEDRVNAYSAGFNAHLGKPFEMAGLLITIRRIIQFRKWSAAS